MIAVWSLAVRSTRLPVGGKRKQIGVYRSVSLARGSAFVTCAGSRWLVLKVKTADLPPGFIEVL